MPEVGATWPDGEAQRTAEHGEVPAARCEGPGGCVRRELLEPGQGRGCCLAPGLRRSQRSAAGSEVLTNRRGLQQPRAVAVALRARG